MIVSPLAVGTKKKSSLSCLARGRRKYLCRKHEERKRVFASLLSAVLLEISYVSCDDCLQYMQIVVWRISPHLIVLTVYGLSPFIVSFAI